jgi:hypothetical protein
LHMFAALLPAFLDKGSSTDVLLIISPSVSILHLVSFFSVDHREHSLASLLPEKARVEYT